ncbi:NAD-dependent epimerase/dehydratase family protein [Allorhizobium sp. BGMRC 0089]|uniref:NAD-dependent epimerase/dehydratase family protein n=1 Tax=Allorhizobium sonneratiae TaxID=2934936 RepID=UPI002033CB7B|nr:NAD-dependent epimerase/dehydratase family protein [Allorhizobium sonneratiae]MCM2291252.1 NAD-dependent epimerase/dehydratase family protein [Allorhizobium sonneratiae]
MTKGTGKCARSVLVLGATGGIGGALARRFKAGGYEVVALHRRAEEMMTRLPDYRWVHGDAMDRHAVIAAAQGVSAIVHGVNPPGYQRWGELVLPMIDHTIAAARAVGATILMPGTLYNYGPDAFPLLKETSPQNPCSIKGAIRVELEQRLEQAAKEGVRVILVRAGDFFGPGAGNNWFAQGLIKPGKPVRAVTLPGRPGLGHSWAYLPDVAETCVRLLEKGEALPPFARFHMRGVYDADGLTMARAIAEAAGQNRLKIRRFAWWLVTALAPFVTLFREVKEMRYLWQEDIRLDNSLLVTTLGQEPNTPLPQAVLATLTSLKCL